MFAAALTLATDGRPFLSSLRASVPLELRRMSRNRRYLMVGVALPLMLYLVFSNTKDAQNASGAARAGFMVSMAIFGAIGSAHGSAVLISQERAAGWMRQLRITPLHPAAHLVAKLAVSYLITAPALLVVGLAGATIGRVSLTPTEWLTTFAVLAIGALPFAELGLLIGYFFDGSSTQGATTISYMGLAILGGLWMPVESLPSALQTAAQAMPSYHLLALARNATVGSALDLGDFVNLAAYAVALGALVAWQYAHRSANA